MWSLMCETTTQNGVTSRVVETNVKKFRFVLVFASYGEHEASYPSNAFNFTKSGVPSPVTASHPAHRSEALALDKTKETHLQSH